MEFNISNLPTLKDIMEIVNQMEPTHQYVSIFHSISVFKYIITIVTKISNKREFIHSFLNIKNVQNKSYYDIFINYLSYDFNPSLTGISKTMLFTNTCQIFHYKIDNNIYNLYDFVENILIDDFNTKLLRCLLLIYYLYDDFIHGPNIHINDSNNYSGSVSNEFSKLFLFKFNSELPINSELNELKIQINELKLELYELSNKLIIQNKDQDEEYIEVD